MRPICAGPKGVTSRLSNFVGILLKPFIKHVKSYIRDDTDFLSKLRTETNEKKVLATFDISNMYTKLDNDLGRDAINFWLEKDPDGLPRNIPKEFVLDALGIVLECYVFFFNNKYYLQIKGCTMGTKLAPTYAILVMAYLELRLYEKIEEKFGQEFRKEFEKQWSRYLDDCFINWDTTFAKVTYLHKTLNSLQRGIDFTMEANQLKSSFFRSYSW